MVQNYRLHLCFVSWPTCRNLFRPHQKHTAERRIACPRVTEYPKQCAYGGGVRYRPGVHINVVTPTDYLYTSFDALSSNFLQLICCV